MIERLAALTRRLSSAPTAVRLAVGLTGAVVVQLVTVLLRPRADLAVFPGWRLLLDLALLAIPAVVTMDLAMRWSTRKGRTGRSLPLMVSLAVVGAAVVASLPVAHARHPASLVGTGPDLIPRALQCFGVGAVLTVLVVLVLRSCTSSRRCVATLTLLGTAAGLSAMAGLHLHCPITHPLHLWSGHITVLLMALFGGLSIGRRRARGSSSTRSRSAPAR